MITTVSLNPSVDRTLSIDGFHYGGMNRVMSSRDDACGKAVNLAIVLSRLGASSSCIGFLAQQGATAFEQRLNENGVSHRFISTPGRVRVNIKLFDEQQHVITEINERGERVTQDDLAQLMQLAQQYARQSEYLVLTGSLPPGCPEDYYETLIRSVGDTCRCVLDADGAPFAKGLMAKPYFIKPNRAELESHLGRRLDTMDEIGRAADALVRQGIALVCVTMGDQGALMASDDGLLFAPPLPLKVRSTVGAGDSLIGGVLHGLRSGEALADAFRMGVAAASASVVSEGTDLVDADIYRQMLDKTIVKRL
ncbi:1-phosphofructokinase family hexose kinase [Eubacteriales bacterium OttesenSCG-928-N13]|nr:1-phosphofructokinase family hexose kinase [Eubacteriales bacterium OttesenSCG-928-N13]